MALLEWLEALSAGQSAVLVAVGVGVIGLLVAFCLSTRGSVSKEEEPKSQVEEISSAVKGKRDDASEPQKKQSKARNTGKPKRGALPSHPLLAADFKGHTGAVLSLDFDHSGKYLVSCSEGE